jgi:hypothetical protein
MENELPVVESKHRHAHGDPNQPGLPTELVLRAPEILVVTNELQWSSSAPATQPTWRSAAPHT